MSSNPEFRHEEVIIIGSGPAAWTAAIYAARANLQPLVVEGALTEANRLANTLPGGQLSLTTEVENFPGFPLGIDGPKLVQQMKEQAVRFGTRVVSKDVTKLYGCNKDQALVLEQAGDPDSIELRLGSAVILATGASARYLDVPGEEEMKNKGVSACAVCDGGLPRFRDKPVVVVGGGDSACEEALYLSKFASTVHLIHRRDQLRASKVMVDRVMANLKISIMWKSWVQSIHGNDEDGVTSVWVDYVNSEECRVLEVSGVFAAIGHKPNTAFLKTKTEQMSIEDGILVNEHGYIITGRDYGWSKGYSTHTNVEGVFAAGDVADSIYRQAITAAGSGCRAAIDVERYLNSKGLT